MNIRTFSAMVVLLILSGCRPVIRNPIELAPFTYTPEYSGRTMALDWSVQTQKPGPEKSGQATVPVGSAGYVTVGPGEIPEEQLLTEAEQREIAARLAGIVDAKSGQDLCQAQMKFEDLDYEFTQHQFWATVSIVISQSSRELYTETARFWSAEHMSFMDRANAHPQAGKRALATQIVDAFVAGLSERSSGELSACVPQ